MANDSANKPEAGVVKADPTLWSEKSKQSYAYYCVTTYQDKDYNCWRCGKKSVFTAVDQKYTYEVRKAHYWQQRILCQECWRQKNAITSKIQDCERKWATSKATLQNDREFLQSWLDLLVSREEYVPYRPNTAIKNMLAKILAENAK